MGFFNRWGTGVSINIKNKEAERLLAEIKARTGRGTTDLLLDMLRRERERLEAERGRRIQDGLEADRRLRERWRALPVADARSLDEIVEFDENGLPR